MGRGRSGKGSSKDNKRFDARGHDDYGDEYDGDQHGRALARLDESANLPALADGESKAPVIIGGSGVPMGNPFIKRRERPLTMRIAILTLVGCILVTGLFAVTPLGTSAEGDASSFQALAGAVVLQHPPAFRWYVAQWGDTPESIATKFGVQVGGIYELNNLLIGQDLAIGTAYKIPLDPNYGADYRPAETLAAGGGTTTFGNSPWTSIAGTPGKEAVCGVNGNGIPMAYRLQSPNWGSYWVRGFSWYHNGVDIAALEGNPIHAAQTGQVIWAGWDLGGLGWSVKINHCNHVSTVYGHMDKLLVTAGQNVTAGQVIGLEGMTGWATGPHLHFMVEWDNNPVNPMIYFNWSTCAITKTC